MDQFIEIPYDTVAHSFDDAFTGNCTINYQLLLRRINIKPLLDDAGWARAILHLLDPAQDQFREWLTDKEGEDVLYIGCNG